MIIRNRLGEKTSNKKLCMYKQQMVLGIWNNIEIMNNSIAQWLGCRIERLENMLQFLMILVFTEYILQCSSKGQFTHL